LKEKEEYQKGKRRRKEESRLERNIKRIHDIDEHQKYDFQI